MSEPQTICASGRNARVIFLAAFLFSSFLFWWLPCLLYRLMGIEDPIDLRVIWMSLAGTVAFIAGYAMPTSRPQVQSAHSYRIDGFERLTYRLTLLLAAPAFCCSSLYVVSRIGVPYGLGTPIPRLFQVVLYVHLFLGLMYLGAANPKSGHFIRPVIASLLISLPRLLISIQGARFFVAQAIVPILFIALGRGWITLNKRRALHLVLLAASLIFVPAISRGDITLLEGDFLKFFEQGSSLNLLQDNLDLNLDGRCPPLLVSLTAKIIPYGAMGVCTIDVFGLNGIPATLDRILSHNAPGTEDLLTGTGSNYLLELYVTGGMTALILGSWLFGWAMSAIISMTSARSAFSGLLALCLPRGLFAPRSDVSYAFEWVLPLAFLALALILAVKANRVLRTSTLPSLHSINMTENSEFMKG